MRRRWGLLGRGRWAGAAGSSSKQRCDGGAGRWGGLVVAEAVGCSSPPVVADRPPQAPAPARRFMVYF